ncbi:diguanylate cyclase [Vibrio sp. FNV 38]|nr:diguanylate cyclase [Vibrio sp. FNV 38]
MGSDDGEHKALISALPDLVFVLTESGRYAAVLGGENNELYHEGQSLVGKTLSQVLPLDKANWFLARIKQTLDSNRLMIFDYSLAGDEVDVINNDSGPGGALRFEGRVNPLPNNRYGERAVIWVARNITERYQLEQQLIYHSETDPLCHIFNRRKLFETLDKAFYHYLRYQDNYAFLLIDIDDFKLVNDTYGHQCGDNAIQRIVQASQSIMRRSDTIGRLGGDEFAVVHKMTSPESAYLLAQRIKSTVSQLIVEPNLCTTPLSVSLGISQFNSQDHSVEQIYSRADIALYASKQKGKNCTSSN